MVGRQTTPHDALLPHRRLVRDAAGPPSGPGPGRGPRQQRFWPMHDWLFGHQGEWAPLAPPRSYFLALSDSLGLGRDAFARCVTSGATAASVRADAERAHRAGATATPSFYIEGALLEGAAPVEVFRAVLDSIYQSKTAP